MKTIRFVSRRARLSGRRFYRRHRSGARHAVMGATAVMVLLPFWLVSSNTIFKDWLSNRAMASTVATVRYGQQLDVMTPKQKQRHKQALNSLLGNRPEMLKDMADQDILLGFSYPSLQRKEGPVRIWQYRSEDCVLDIFFGEAEKGNATAQVVHYEIRPRHKAYLTPPDNFPAANQPDSSRCVKSLMNKG